MLSKIDISDLSPVSSGIVYQLEMIKSVVFNCSKRKNQNFNYET